MKLHSRSDTISAPSKLAMHHDSHVISKFKPKIRIIHIFAPKIIETDVENFRELVQSLTGKTAGRKDSAKNTTSKKLSCDMPIRSDMEESKFGIHIQQNNGEMMKKEVEEMYEGGNNRFFGGFADMDGFIQDFSEYPLLPFKSSKINMFSEMPLCL